MNTPPLSAPRYSVGIDLGTTNSAMAFTPLQEDGPIQDFQILQLVAPGETERRQSLPSFHYEPHPAEADGHAFDLPWSRKPESVAIGVLARDRGALAPGRLVASAKSWMCHAGVDRRAPVLPWHGVADARRFSPVEVAARYLSHMRAAWDYDHPNHPLHQQEVIVTLPASFDEVARELTAEAISIAGLRHVTLLEEPQAAFYAWMAAHPREWPETIGPGQQVLVCDIGGGTTDLSLIETVADEAHGLAFRRQAVGDHLILGGDNLDLALAHHMEERLAQGPKLDPRQWSTLVRLCCQAKERLLGPNAPDSLTLTLPASGRRLVGGSLQTELAREDVIRWLVDGFLPFVPSHAEPDRAASGFREFGLPYASDAAITRYIAEFLRRHTDRPPDALLLNGGFFASPALQSRLIEVLSSWSSGTPPPRLLHHERLDMAVARGAAHYGLVRRGHAPRISGGLPRSYYAGVADAQGRLHAVCVAPSGLEEGSSVDVPGHVFDLLVRQPAEFPLYFSSLRTTDAPGDVVDLVPAHLSPLPPMRTVLKIGKNAVRSTVQVGLHCRITELGTFETWCRELDGNRQWQLRFDLRPQPAALSPPPVGDTIEESIMDACFYAIRTAFAGHADSLSALPRTLMESAGIPREDWPPLLLRRLWETLIDLRDARRISPAHEARWLNLAGFFLRPGFGVPLDDWRVEETWKIFSSGVVHAKNELCRAEWWILWRRIAGGLSDGRQVAIATPLLARLKTSKGRFAAGHHETAEIWRLLASLERLPPEVRRTLGDSLSHRFARRGWAADNGAVSWALARLAAREPIYGPLHACMDADLVSQWILPMLDSDSPRPENLVEVALMARRTGDRFRDLDDETRSRILHWMQRWNATPHLISLVEEGGDLSTEDQVAAAGDTLPIGLRWPTTP